MRVVNGLPVIKMVDEYYLNWAQTIVYAEKNAMNADDITISANNILPDLMYVASYINSS